MGKEADYQLITPFAKFCNRGTHRVLCTPRRGSTELTVELGKVLIPMGVTSGHLRGHHGGEVWGWHSRQGNSMYKVMAATENMGYPCRCWILIQPVNWQILDVPWHRPRQWAKTVGFSVLWGSKQVQVLAGSTAQGGGYTLLQLERGATELCWL